MWQPHSRPCVPHALSALLPAVPREMLPPSCQLRREVPPWCGSALRLSSYIVYATLADMPRAVLHVVVVFGIGYHWVGLNPNPAHRNFIICVAWLGTCAFQSMVCAVAFLTDRPGPVYGILFLLVGMGSLFGGLMVSWSNIVPQLKWCYYGALNAFEVRSIVLINSLSNPYYLVECSQLGSEGTDLMAQVPQLNPFSERVNVTELCAEAASSLQNQSVGGASSMMLLPDSGGAAVDTDATVDLGPVAL